MDYQSDMIEFFSGSKTVADCFLRAGYKTLTIDSNPKLCADLCVDVLNLVRSDLPGNVSFLWFSVPCPEMSKAGKQSHWLKKTIKYRVYDYQPNSDRALKTVSLVHKVIEIISWYPGARFVIENPVGRLHQLLRLTGLGHYRYFVNYADFGFSYSKETYLFTNFMMPLSVKKTKVTAPGLRTINSEFQRSKVPAALVNFIIYQL